MQHLEALEQASGGARELKSERAGKRERLHAFLESNGFNGVLLRRHENLSWITAGQFEARVGILREAAVGALLLLCDGRTFLIAPNNEAPRLTAEEVPGLQAELVTRPWHSLDFAAEAVALGGGRIASDMPLGSQTVVDLGPLRAPLFASEVSRYRALCSATAEVVSETLLALEPGVSEYEMEARTAERLLAQGMFPSVLLMAVDDRILRYKHAVARGAKLRRYGMLNLCTRRWGLACSITRFVHFGALPPEVERGFSAVAQVNAALQVASRENVTADALFHAAVAAYGAAGYAGEEQLHHQGGACGYLEREWVAAPGGQQKVRSVEAFAWNPSCRGGKVEDTTLLLDGTMELLTRTPALPEVVTERNGHAIVSAGPLVRL